VRISLDDFGTGHSSLSYLKRFPVDTLKIDQSFVRDITSDPDTAAIVTGIIAMAHSLRLKVIAEGVEFSEQSTFLKRYGCDQMQGYLIKRPVSAAAFLELLAQPAIAAT
jgi:EAL domain-containing protein (putative c-di-GMP-specific phosphodiesterase class I)